MEDGVDDPQARFVAGTLRSTRVICVYVPNGREVGSEPFEYKLAWLRRLRTYLDVNHAPDEPLVVCGDFNCAPEDRDVAKLESWRDSVLCHGDVRDSIRALTQWGVVDTFRKHHDEGGLYSWWDYRRLGFPKNNGLRIDQVHATKPLLEQCKAQQLREIDDFYMSLYAQRFLRANLVHLQAAVAGWTFGGYDLRACGLGRLQDIGDQFGGSVTV